MSAAAENGHGHPAEHRDALLGQIQRDITRLYVVSDRAEDRLAVLLGRVSNIETLLARQSKLLVDIAEKLGVGL